MIQRISDDFLNEFAIKIILKFNNMKKMIKRSLINLKSINDYFQFEISEKTVLLFGSINETPELKIFTIDDPKIFKLGKIEIPNYFICNQCQNSFYYMIILEDSIKECFCRHNNYENEFLNILEFIF